MKISIISDCHLNKSLYNIFDKDNPSLPFRTVDYMVAFNSIIEQNLNEIEPDLIVIAGDVYDTFDPSNDLRAFFNLQCKKVIDKGIKLIVLVGNHDICKKHHALLPIKVFELNNLHIVDQPVLMKVGNKNLMLFPYSMDVESGKIKIKEQFHQFIKSSHETIANDPELKGNELFFFGHFGVKGATLKSSENQTVVSKKMVNKNSDDIGISDLEDIKADYVFLGDYHKYQILPTKNTIAMYTGSIEKTDMSEIGQAKGYVVYDDDRAYDEKTGKTYFVEYANCRPMIELKGNAQSIIEAITKLPDGMDGAIVKISFEGDRKELVDFSIALDSIRSTIKDKVDPVHMFSQQKIIEANVIDKSESKLEDAIFEKGHLDEDLVMKVVEELISEKESNLIEQVELINLAKDIYKETLLQ